MLLKSTILLALVTAMVQASPLPAGSGIGSPLGGIARRNEPAEVVADLPKRDPQDYIIIVSAEAPGAAAGGKNDTVVESVVEDVDNAIEEVASDVSRMITGGIQE
ncbi:MAG: hypothetical protein Q9168_002866 [Polycauliona sp. 1 TL-2023]